jgi:DNA-binding NarL/FixJ family response regulator
MPLNANAGKASVLVVDDHPLFRHGVVLLIDRQNDLYCCGEADSVATAQAAVAAKKPRVVLLDLRLGNEDGVELIKALKARFAALHILVLSQYDEALYAERALRAGANGYVMKEEATEEVLVALRTVLAGQPYVSRKMAALVLHKMLETKPNQQGDGVANLTDRELQVFQLVGAGLSARQIAVDLHVSFKTIQTHRENIKHKLGLRTAAELVCHASAWIRGSAPTSVLKGGLLLSVADTGSPISPTPP